VTAWRAALAAVALALAAPSSAAAHAGFVSSTPANDAVVEVSPDQIVLRFNQAVKAGSVRLFDGVGERVTVGKVEQPSPDQVVAAIDTTLERDSYTVVWRVISDDVDPVDGFVVFHVGAPRAPPAAAAAGAGDAEAGPSAGRIAVYVLVLLCAVGVATLLLARVVGRLAALAGAVGAAALLAVVAVAAGLVDATPARTESERAEPFRAEVQMGTLHSRLAVLPASAGWNRIELELPPPAGTDGGYFEVRVWASLESAGVGPLRFTGIQGTELGSFAVRRAFLPLPGSWRVRVSARRGVSGRYATTITVPVPAR